MPSGGMEKWQRPALHTASDILSLAIPCELISERGETNLAFQKARFKVKN